MGFIVVDQRTGQRWGGAISDELQRQRAAGVTLFVASYFDGQKWDMLDRHHPLFCNGGASEGIYDITILWEPSTDEEARKNGGP